MPFTAPSSDLEAPKTAGFTAPASDLMPEPSSAPDFSLKYQPTLPPTGPGALHQPGPFGSGYGPEVPLSENPDAAGLKAFSEAAVPAVDYALHNPVTKGLGIGLDATGKILRGGLQAGLLAATGNPDLARQELVSAGDAFSQPAGREPTTSPYEEGRQSLPLPARMAAGVVPSLVQTAPQLALTAIQPELGAASFGLTPEGFDPVTAATMMVAPQGGKILGGIIEKVAAKAGISSAKALDTINRAGGAAGVAGVMSAPSVYQISQMPAGEERDKAIEDTASNAILIGLLGTQAKREQPAATAAQPKEPNAETIRGNPGQLRAPREVVQAGQEAGGNDVEQKPPGQSESVETRGQVQPQTPRQPVITPHDLQPAFRAGENIYTDGETHNEIISNARKANPDDASTLAILEAQTAHADPNLNPNRGFIDKNGNWYSRQEATDALNKSNPDLRLTEPLQSEKLKSLKEQKPISQPEVEAAKNAPAVENQVAIPPVQKESGQPPGQSETVEKPAAEIPLGLNRPNLTDESLSKMPDDEFDSHFKNAKQNINRVEKQWDEIFDSGKELTNEQKKEIAAAQDVWSAADNERFRRNNSDTHTEDIFHKMIDLADVGNDYSKFKILADILTKRGGAKAKDVTAIYSSLPERLKANPDFKEALSGKLGKFKEWLQKYHSEKSPKVEGAPEKVSDAKEPAETIETTPLDPQSGSPLRKGQAAETQTPPVATGQMTKAESDELSALREKDLSEDGLAKDEEQRMYELSRKEIRSKRAAQTSKLAAQLKEQGIEIPDSFLHPSDGVENHIHSWTYDHRNGMIQIRIERHTDATMSGRLITVKAGDVLIDGMDDSKVGTTRYREANPDSALRAGEKPQTPPGANPGTSKLSPAVRQSTPQSLGGKDTAPQPATQVPRSRELILENARKIFPFGETAKVKPTADLQSTDVMAALNHANISVSDALKITSGEKPFPTREQFEKGVDSKYWNDASDLISSTWNHLRTLGLTKEQFGKLMPQADQFKTGKEYFDAANDLSLKAAKSRVGEMAALVRSQFPQESARPTEQSEPQVESVTPLDPATGNPVSPKAAPVQKFRVGRGPQLYSMVEKLPQTEVEKENGEQAVRVKNDKTGETHVVMESDLTPVKELPAGQKGKKTSVEDRLKALGYTVGQIKAMSKAGAKALADRGQEIIGMGGAIPAEFTDANRDIYGIAERVRRQREKAEMTAPTTPGKGIAPEASVQRGRQLLKSGADPEKIMSDFEKTQRASSDDFAIARAHGETLARITNRTEENFGTDSPEFRAAYKTESDWAARTKAMQTEWAKSGHAQQGETDIDTGTFLGIKRAYRDSHDGHDLPEKYNKKAQRLADENRRLENENARLLKQLGDKLEKEVPPVDKSVPEMAPTVENTRAAFSDYKGGEMTKPQVRALWNYTRKNYVNKGNADFSDIVRKVSTDLGMSFKDVANGLAQPAGAKKLTDELWRKQTDARRVKESAKRWVRQISSPILGNIIPWLARKHFGAKVFGHGGVAFGTHAPMVAFMPKYWKTYFQDYKKMWAMNFSPSRYEMEVQSLRSDPNFNTAARAGLVNDPYKVEDFNNPDMTGAIGSSGTAGKVRRFYDTVSQSGNRGYFALKLLRQDMFNQGWDTLPESIKTPEMAKAMADDINHITGVVKSSVGGNKASLFFFAPRLLMSRAAFLAGDPYKAVEIATTAMSPAKWKALPPEQKFHVINQVKQKATILAVAYGLLEANKYLLQAVGSKQQINTTDPTRSDFMKFKGAGMDFSYGNAMLNMARLPVRLWTIGEGDGGKLKHVIYPDESMYSAAGEFLRSQASPLAGLGLDLIFKGDYQNRPLPQIPGYGAPIPVPKRLKAQGVGPYTWPEFFAQQVSPIPFQEAEREIWRSGFGLSDEQQKSLLKAAGTTMVMMGTGGRLTEDLQPH